MTTDPPPRIDTTVPHPARWYDYWLGGKDNWAVDREFGDRVRDAFPGIVSTARENRRMLGRLVTHLARDHGIRQFLDIGTGLPTADNVHEVAQRVDPTARIVYVDNDRLVMVHARALLTSTPEGATNYLEADLCEPEKILSSAEVTGTLDLGQPVALLMFAVLHFVEDDAEAADIVHRFAAGLAPGSYVGITHGTFQGIGGATSALDSLRTSGRYHFFPRTREQVAALFDGFDLVDPGVVNIVDWQPDEDPQPKNPAEEVAGYAGLARLP